MKRKMRLLGLFAGLLSCGGAFAGSVTCSGTVTSVNYHASNSFMIQLSSMNTPVFFCNTESTFSVPGTTYTTGAQTCKAFIAMFIAARESGRTITAMYFDGDAVPATCDGWGAWSSANIRYFNY